MNDITTLGLVVTAQRDAYSPDLKISELQLFALTDNQVKEMAKEFDSKSISTEFLTFSINDESSMRWLLRYTKTQGRSEDFEKAFNMVMTFADNDISEKLITLEQKGLFNLWLDNKLDNTGNPVSTVETSQDSDACALETLNCLLDRINDPVLKDEVLKKFKASLSSSE